MNRFREPANGLTHLIGAVLSVVALGILLVIGIRGGDMRQTIGFAIFGLSQIGLYTASTLHHSLRLSERNTSRLLRFDCMMVYILIAGTYTPICLGVLHGAWRWGMLGAIWGLALGGIVTMAHWMRAPNWVSTGFYVLMGWMALAILPQLFHALPAVGIVWLFAGGVVYTVGAVIFVLERPILFPGVFEAHALWHLCVLGGSFCFFWVIVRYIAPLSL